VPDPCLRAPRLENLDPGIAPLRIEAAARPAPPEDDLAAAHRHRGRHAQAVADARQA
jgi:hypothetical protein